MKKKPILAMLAAVSVAVLSSSAFTAGNSVPVNKAGDGAAAISGYVADSVHYTLNSSNPQNIDAVAFTLDVAPIAGSTIRARLVSGGSTWYSCTNSGAAVSCGTTSPAQATAVSANQLTVVVAD